MSRCKVGDVSFVGLGSMGWPMAANLVASGFHVTVTDTDIARARSFAATVGGSAVATAEEAISQSSSVVTMLPTSQHVTEVVHTNFDSFASGSLLIDMTSGVPQISRTLAIELGVNGVGFIDCPVSGGVRRAQAGDLSIMAGGSVDDIDRAMPLLMAVGSAVQRCGDIGAGHAVKALNNLTSAGGFLIGVEALLIGQAHGVDPALMVDVFNHSSGMNNSTKDKFKQHVLSGTFSSGFGLDLMVKDLGIAVDVARDNQVVAPFATLCHQLWSAAAVQLGPGSDHTDMARFCEQLAGIELSTSVSD